MTGEELKEIRKKSKLSQYKLAEMLGLYAPNICNMENGKLNIRPYIEKLINALIKTGELKNV